MISGLLKRCLSVPAFLESVHVVPEEDLNVYVISAFVSSHLQFHKQSDSQLIFLQLQALKCLLK